MSKLEKEVKKIIKDNDSRNSDDEFKSFLEASEYFDKLVEKGVIKRRGNQQLSIEDAHLKNYSINSQ